MAVEAGDLRVGDVAPVVPDCGDVCVPSGGPAQQLFGGLSEESQLEELVCGGEQEPVFFNVGRELVVGDFDRGGDPLVAAELVALVDLE